MEIIDQSTITSLVTIGVVSGVGFTLSARLIGFGIIQLFRLASSSWR